MILEIEALLAAIYMDPRTKFVLSEEQKFVAQQNNKKTASSIELKKAS